MKESQFLILIGDIGIKRAVENKSVFFVCNGTAESAWVNGCVATAVWEYRAEILISCTVTFSRFLGEDGLYVMISMVREYLKQNVYDHEEETYVQFILTGALHTSGHLTQMQTNVTHQGAAFHSTSFLFIAQKMLARWSFISQMRFDCTVLLFRKTTRTSHFSRKVYFNMNCEGIGVCEVRSQCWYKWNK